MNGESLSGSGENLNNTREQFKKDAGEITVANYDLMSQEERDQMSEQIEQQRKEALKQWIEINKMQAEIAEANKRHAEYLRQKELAKGRGLIGVTGWCNKHPEELKEFVHPQLQNRIEEMQKAHAENGTSFYGLLKDSMDLTRALEDQAAAAKRVQEILNADISASQAEIAQEEMVQAADVEVAPVEPTEPAEPAETTMPQMSAEEFADQFDTREEEKSENAQDFDILNDMADKNNEAIMKDHEEEEVGQEVTEQLMAVGNAMIVSFPQKMVEKSYKNKDEAVADVKAEIIDIKEAKIEETRKKYGMKHGFKRLMTRVLAAALVTMTLITTGCANKLDQYVNDRWVNPAKAATEEMVDGESAEAEAEKPAMEVLNNVKEDSAKEASAEAENTAETPSYRVTFQMENIDGVMEEVSMDLRREAQAGAENPYNAEVRENGEAQTADKKETKGAFGTILVADELNDDHDAVERGYLGEVVTREAVQPQLLAYRAAWGGSYDSLAGRTFGGPTQDNPMFRGSQLMNVNGVYSLDKANHDAQLLSTLSQEELQTILDASTEAEMKAWDGKTVKVVSFAANKSYITAHLEKEADSQGKDVYKLAVASSSKPLAFDVVQRINENGENEFDQGETKLNILKTHGLVDADMTLEEAEQNGVMKRYTVWGERNKCGGQMVITENVAKKKTKKVENPEPVIVNQTFTTQQVIPIGGAPVSSTVYTPPSNPSNPSTPDKPSNPSTPSTPDKPSTPETPVTPTLEGKTMTNPWAERNPEQMDVSKSVEQISAENGGATVVQAGEEQVPVVDTSGVNTAPEAQQDWAEAPTAPVEDTGVNPEDQSASSDAGAAAALAAAESGSSGGGSSESTSSSSSESGGSSESSGSSDSGSSESSDSGSSESSESSSENEG